MPDEAPTNVYSLVAVVLVALISGTFAFLSARASKKAGEDAVRIDNGVTSVEGWVKLTEGYERRMRSLEESQQTTDQVATELRGVVMQLTRDVDALHNWKRAALRYILELYADLRDHVAEEDLPRPPEELYADLRDHGVH